MFNPRILCLYDSTQTYTNTVFDWLSELAKIDNLDFYFVCIRSEAKLLNLESFDGVLLHYSVRPVFGNLSIEFEQKLTEFNKYKAMSIQDEYDNLNGTASFIKRTGIHHVLTCVPATGVSEVYGSLVAEGIKFSHVLTGYAFQNDDFQNLEPPSKRQIFCGYRARKLPLRYGQLGIDKWRIPKEFSLKLEQSGISNIDIDCDEASRIYGENWISFLRNCRATIATESGCNVFDFDGGLNETIKKLKHLGISDSEILSSHLAHCTFPGLMNQISPRVFEAIANRSALVLTDGKYSGIVTPYEHYIPLNHDLANFDEVLRLLRDDEFIDKMTIRAYDQVACNDKYSWKSLQHTVQEVFGYLPPISEPKSNCNEFSRGHSVTTLPLRPRNSDALKIDNGTELVIRTLLKLSFVASLNKINFLNSLGKKLVRGISGFLVSVRESFAKGPQTIKGSFVIGIQKVLTLWIFQRLFKLSYINKLKKYKGIRYLARKGIISIDETNQS